MIEDLISMHECFGIRCSRHRRISEGGVMYAIPIKRSRENYVKFGVFAGFEHAIVARGYNIGKPKKALLADRIKYYCRT
ncbi:MAG TPA: hypothetical protein HA254_03640 [Candidatus Diapherotrites archaeon]|uniref:Uncharacterized protein n=1 Tax=Candidatus Iainarchaeum sp. TaxID=3101447 RepID=A0A7J4IZQ1_9ARCH|nr:hypothetical protein [Candidatus Diapherotrites archaeon]